MLWTATFGPILFNIGQLIPRVRIFLVTECGVSTDLNLKLSGLKRVTEYAILSGNIQFKINLSLTLFLQKCVNCHFIMLLLVQVGSVNLYSVYGRPII